MDAVRGSVFEDLLLATHKADSSASTNEMNSDKLYVLARNFSDRGLEYYLYYIDLSSASKDKDNSIRSLQPTLHFWDGYGCFAYHEYVVMGSKLFMIGGMDLRHEGWMGGWCWYDFSDAMDSSTTTYVKKKYLKMGPPMEGKKHSPIAAVVDGNEICVFASLLYHSSRGCEAHARR